MKIANINEDAAEFYEDAAEKIEDPQMKTTFKNLESLHNSVKVTLESQVQSNGGDFEAYETFVGGMKQLFGEIEAKISNDKVSTFVKHLEEAEDRCLHSMQDAIDSDDIRETTKTMLSKELATLRKSHDYMKALKESLAA